MNIEQIINSARELIPGQASNKKPQLTRDQAMAAQPIRNPSLKWRENDDGEAIIVLPRRRDWVGRFLGWMFFVPEAKPIALDDVGTFVWNQCDGESSVIDIVRALSDEYKLGTREAEVSLTQFLQTLAKRGMIGFLVPREIADQLGEKEKRVLGLREVGTTEEDLRRAQEQSRAEQGRDEAAEGDE